MEKLADAFTIGLAVVLAGGLVSSSAVGGETTTPLLHADLADMNGTEANIALIEVDPGYQTERHIHPGHVFIYVLDGAIEIDVAGQEPLVITAGQAAHELPNQPMVGRNVSATDGARFIVFQVGPMGEPLTVPQAE